MINPEITEQLPVNPQRRRLKTALGGAAIAGTAALVESNDEFFGFELVPNLITFPVLLGGIAVAMYSGKKFFQNLRKKSPSTTWCNQIDLLE